MNQRLRPAVSEPVILMFSRQQVETGDITEPLQLLRRLTADRQTAIDFCGRISLVVDGYNDDPRELFEVPVPSRRQRSSKLRRMARMLVAAKNRGNLARKDGGEWLTVEVDKKGAD